MKLIKSNCLWLVLLSVGILGGCGTNISEMKVEVFETSASGNSLSKRINFSLSADSATIRISIQPEEKFQEITGFGGAFTEASAHLLNQMSQDKRDEIMEAYFGESGARYSLTRTHINSCDFSLSNYSYADVPGDTELSHFSIEPDLDDLIPMIKSAQKVSKEGFRILASPWTAPPWMKDNNAYVGGKLLPEYHDSWALFFSKYIKAYQEQGIPIWGVTVENEPLGNGNNWESMHYTPKEMTDFVRDYLGPKLETDGFGEVKILGYDQNREHLNEWIDAMYKSEENAQYFDGTAIHWYASTYEVFPDALQYAHKKAPGQHLIQSEACVDAEIPHWQEDAWYWEKEATDWGFDWALEKDKYLHPKYVPVYRYARDIIGCLNNWVDGWIDWNMVLDRKGGPNWFKNWCVAPVIVDPEQNQVYYTPLFYTLSHFSRYIRPGAYRVGFEVSESDIEVTAAENPDGSLIVVLFNPTEQSRSYRLEIDDSSFSGDISGQAIQTLVVKRTSLINK